jgi:DNA-binding NarL/FixJ family response regulator
MQSNPMNSILVIDEIPVIAIGLQEIFRPLHPPILLEHTDNFFTVLSSRSYQGKKFDCLIIGEQTDRPFPDLPQSIAEWKGRFGPGRVMLYTPNYAPALIEKMEETGIDAYVHKYEPLAEILEAWSHLSEGKSYISAIFHTLYYEYGLRPDQIPLSKG